jgi:hypothetical protein
VITAGGSLIPRILLGALCISLGAYFLSPALTAVHVEGLSAQIQSLAVALARGGIASHDPYLPLVTEFIFLTCPGVVDLLAFLHVTLGIDGDAAFRLLTIVSLAVMLAAAVMFARNRGSVGKAAALAALILTPGVIESGFFFNDNVVSAAFAALSLALLTPMAATWRYLASGVLAGMAVLCRLDGLFVLPLLVGVVLIETAPRPRAPVRLVALAAGFLITMVVSAAANGATLLDSLLIGRYFSYARQTGFDMRVSLFALRYFFGPITPLLLIIGIARKYQSGIIVRYWLDSAFFLVYPLLLCVFAVMTGREVRYVYPLLAPIIALHGGRGIEWLVKQVRKPAGQRKTLVLIPVLGVCAVTLFTPPAVVVLADGPRALVGRLWAPVLWWRWQHGVNQSMTRLASLTAELDREPAPLILTSAWNDEFYVRLRLIERGYISTTAAETFPGCDGFSVYTRGQHRILHLRLHNEFYLVPYAHTTYGALAITRAAACPALEAVTNTWVTTFGSKGENWIDPALLGFGYERFQQPLEVTYTRDWLRDLLTHRVQTESSWCCSDGLIDAVEIAPAERATIIANARAIALNSANQAHTTPAAMFAAGREANRGRTRLTQDRWP